MISRNDPCWCGSEKKWKKCHYPKSPTKTPSLKEDYLKRYGIILKTAEEIEKIKTSCQIAASILDELCKKTKKGVTTEELDELSRQLHKEKKATPAPLGYGEPPFPKTICTSINEEICHGIPGPIPLQEGDIINIDVSSIYEGFFGDCSRMVAIGKIDAEKKKVMDTSYECLHKAIKICKPGVLLSEIGRVIEEYALEKKCSVVNQFVGHGIGASFHEPPEVPHHYNHSNIPLAPGMIFTIEPMINAGKREGVIDPDNHWTARTKDGKPSAQWEHTILITDTGHEILTNVS